MPEVALIGQRSLFAGDRDVAVDAARGLALISMLVAHTAPAAARTSGTILYLSEWLTAPLFATLIGMGSWLGWSRVRPEMPKARGRFLAGVAVRAFSLVGIGLLLGRLDHQVVIVLVYLGVLTLIAAPVAWLPTGAVALTGVAATVIGSLLRTDLVSLEQSRAPEGPWATALEVVATGDSYRVTHLLAWACLGIILARRSGLSRGFLGSRPRDHEDHRDTRQLVRGDALLAGSALVLAAAMMLARLAGLLTMAPYVGTNPEVVFDAFLCTAVVCGTAALVPLLPRPIVAPFAAAGSMMLTLYVIQILVLATFVALAPTGRLDDSWAMLFGLTLGLFAFAALWRDVVRSGPFRRGPLEGLIGLCSRALTRW